MILMGFTAVLFQSFVRLNRLLLEQNMYNFEHRIIKSIFGTYTSNNYHYLLIKIKPAIAVYVYNNSTGVIVSYVQLILFQIKRFHKNSI